MSKKINSQSSIPASKVQRAAKFMKTGMKVGKNYVKHYAKKVVDPSLSKDDLHAENAEDIYDSLSELKGSALKVAQMMSMDKNVLPQAYSDKFQMAQYSAPPLSYPLVVKTFRKAFGKTPTEIFDSFSKNAVNAASIGQVHQASKNNKTFAVKVQYPGVAESVKSDLKMVKPFAVRIAGLNEKDVDLYMEEVQNMLLSETDYQLELKRSIDLSEKVLKVVKNVQFPKYYPEYSSDRVLTMDWMQGKHLGEFLNTNPSQEIRNQLGQALWDFYDYQIHVLHEVHADPHPGNFFMDENGTLGIIDFGCVKVIPKVFYDNYFVLIDGSLLEEKEKLRKALFKLNFLHSDDSESEMDELQGVLLKMLELLGRPFREEEFDFGNDNYFQEIYDLGDESAKVKALRYSKKPRGAKDGLYLNRTYFGLYNILNQLKANIKTTSPLKNKEVLV
ncbi:ABC1 kinase family protein [Flexithrix dorotheae]|uniref:ABC1 kinase family protein n=1 Tax=Flexithrix dorotheae TaxID=70993 RepID=UPI000362782F|nr:AarF/ABC1/UbiB kinase family protein [Flexithrix dorotheae]